MALNFSDKNDIIVPTVAGTTYRGQTELITTGAYQSIDISNMAVERVLGKEARPEPYVL